MPRIKLPIYEGMNKAVDEVGLQEQGADMVNVYVDDLLNINRWPGYEEFADTGEASKVDGLFWWENQSKVIAICNGKTFEITDSNGTIAEITGDDFETGTRVKFADFGSSIYGANGGRILKLADALNFNAQDGSFTAGNKVYQYPSGAYADIVYVSQDGSTGTLYLENINGNFEDDQIIYEKTYGSELITNGDMELDSNWTSYGTPTTNERSSTQKHGGTYSRKFTPDAANEGIQSDVFTTTTGSFYFIDSYIYPDDSTTVNLRAGRGDGVGNNFTDTYTLTQDAWNNVTKVYQEVAGGASGRVKFESVGEISGDWYVDDVSLKQITNAAMANGTVSNISYMADPDAPTEVTHISVLDRYLIANESNGGNFHWADVGSPTAWSGNYSEAEANPDRLVALDVQNLTLHLLGKKTLEKWYDDGSTPFIRLYQGLVQSGTVAPYSFAWCNSVQTFCWLDENRRVVMLQDGVAAPLSLTINKYIQNFTTVSDAIGDYVEIVGRPFYILTFPSEEKVLAYDFISKNWYRLASWNATNAEYDLYRGNCYCLSPAWNMTLMGDRANGKIYKLDPTVYDEDGSLLRSLIQTAHYNHGSESRRKYCNGIYVRLKRTQTVSEDGTPDLMVQYRDDGSTTWTTARTLTMHSSSNTEFLAYTTRLGSYYARQWQFYMTDAYPLCIASVEEDVDIENE